jgi:hypothetical protein
MVERHDEADACALVHACLQNLGEPFDGFGERRGLECGDLYGLLVHDLTGIAQRCPFGKKRRAPVSLGPLVR